MTRPARILCALCALCLLYTPLRAGEKRLGAFFSPKGLGLSFQLDNDWGDEIRAFHVFADMYGVYSGRTSDVGIMFSYSHNYILRLREFGYSTMSFYVGAGFLGGYVHDFELGLFSKDNHGRVLQDPMGLVVALQCDIGLSFDFDRHVTIDIGFSLCPGLHVSRDSDTGTVSMSVYERGLISTVFPQLCIYYRF